MKRANNLYERLISEPNLLRAIKEVNRTHRRCCGKLNRTVVWVEKDIPARVNDLRIMIENGFVPSPYRERERWDKSAGKMRNICEPRLWPDQYVHHALVQVLQPAMMRGMDPFCCGSIPGRGVHYGMKAIKKWMKDDVSGTRWCLELDIHHFYDSLSPFFVMARLRRLVKDRRTLDLVERVIQGGIRIGVYTSQWFANTTLQPLDHLIREGGYGVKHYLRYMDNFTIFSNRKRSLKKALAAIRAWLYQRGLKLKGNWQIYRTDKRMPTAMGYRYGRGYTLLRKRNLLRLKRHVTLYSWRKRTGRKVRYREAAGLLSRFGQLSHCNHMKIHRSLCGRNRIEKGLKAVVRARPYPQEVVA